MFSPSLSLNNAHLPNGPFTAILSRVFPPSWSFYTHHSPGSRSHTSKSCGSHYKSYLSSAYRSIILMFLAQKGTTVTLITKTAKRYMSSLPRLTARAIQPVSPFVMQRSSLPLVPRSRVKSSSRQQILTLGCLSPLIPTCSDCFSH